MKKKWLVIVALFAIAVVLAMAIPAFLPTSPGVTYANFSRVKKGMTRAEVETLLGQPEIELNTRCVWETGHGVFVWITFDKNGDVEVSTWNGQPDNRTSLERLRDRIPIIAHKPPGIVYSR